MKATSILTFLSSLKETVPLVGGMIVAPGLFARTATTQENNNWQK